jgi:transposase
VFETMHDRLRQQWRDRVGKAPDPSAAITDTQRTRSRRCGGNTGFDAGKKVKGRKRHIVDTLGLLLTVPITAASVQDRDAAAPVVALACAKVPGLKKLYADAAYGGRCREAIEQTHGIGVEIVRRPANRSTGTRQDAQQPLWPEVVAKGFVVQAKRWVVERTHAWSERAAGRLMAYHDRSDWAAVAWVWHRGRFLSSSDTAAKNGTLLSQATPGLAAGALAPEVGVIDLQAAFEPVAALARGHGPVDPVVQQPGGGVVFGVTLLAEFLVIRFAR